MTLGSVTMDTDATFNGSPGTTTITSDNASDYVIQNSGTFTHNSGTVLISSSTGQKIVSDDYFYNLTVKDDSGGLRWLPSALLIANDLEVSNGASLRPENTANTLTVSGTATVQDTSSYLGPLYDTYTGSHTLGALTIGTNGTYYAPGSPGITNIGVSGHAAPNFTNNGTFTHNSGTVRTSRYNTTDTVISGSPLVFYNLQSYAWDNQEVMYIADSLQVENEFDVNTPNAGMSRINADDVVITIGTDTSSGSLFCSQTWLGDLGIFGNNCMITAKNELYPANIGPYLRSTYFNNTAGDNLYLRWLNFVQDFPASNYGVIYTLSGACEFGDCTIPVNDTLNTNGYRAEFSGALVNSGTVNIDDSLLVFTPPDGYAGQTWDDDGTTSNTTGTNIMINGGTSQDSSIDMVLFL
jgi:hypothetical protein